MSHLKSTTSNSESESPDNDEFRSRLLSRWDKGCRLLVRAFAVCGILLLLLQLLLQAPTVRQLICPVEELEGIRVRLE